MIKQTYNTCLVTGGTGTFGKSYTIKAIEKKWHKKIVIFSRDEFKQLQFKIFLSTRFKDKNLIDKGDYSISIDGCEIRFIIGDIRNLERVLLACNGVDLVIHSAALKHVPVCEYNTEEAISTNITGSLNIAKAAHAQKVRHLVCLSTDKAVDPINLYGATKMCLEKAVLNYRFMSASETIYSVVRYGNVIASRGSLIEKLLDTSQFPSITNPDMTRFWMRIEDSIDLVRKSLELDTTGIVIVPHMKSLSIAKTFEYLRPELIGKESGGRVGEKKHECILSDSERHLAFSCKEFTLINGSDSKYIDKTVKAYDLKPVNKEKYCSCDTERFNQEDFKKLVTNTIINELNS